MTIDPDDDAADPKFVTALARGLDLLSSFRKNEVELSNHTFVERTGLPKATVTRLTYTLCKLGYLVQSAPGGLYRLGPGVLRLGFGALASTDMKDRAEVELRDLCAGGNPNVAAAIAERHDLSAVYLVTHRAPSAILTAFYLGAQVPLFSTSIGRALLMGMPEQDSEALLKRACDRARSDEERAGFVHGLARARADFAAYGFCTSFSEWRKEINGIAAPIVPVEGDRIFALNVGGVAFLNSAEELMETRAERLLRAARTLSLRPTDHD
ncbi:hypothetical protein LL06_00205 [Hoeflea sp. BAL378]|uniref:IclR family transcriptional regulator n=1 Tax=Hoeflea sp. BAL378 TaxID=1547437 RepID=UPI000513E182|nr:IclR family transcriptional regulator [Hoeflea sp. BAL378]KGF71256.1 hypothetical protein LL06_00205 [Hoeflea sp. BAL378]